MLSVIVPIYNVEAYVERCVRSLMEQTLEDMEFIFVNDCSTDASMDVLQRVIAEYPHRMGQIHIINQPVNRGVAAARTAGMQLMHGDYMAHCDSDDWIDPDAYQLMYQTAIDDDADIVTCTYLNEPNAQKAEGAVFTGTAHECLKQGKFTYGLWDKIIRTSIVRDNDIYPIPGINYNEDLNVIVRVLCHSKRVLAIDRPLYHHLVGREGSICNTGYRNSVLTHSVPSMRLLDEYLDDYGRMHPQSGISSRATDPLKFWMKAGFYTAGDYKTWRELWPECRRYIPKIKSLSFKEKVMMLWHSI